MAEVHGSGLTRRDLLAASLAGGALLATGGLAACGNDATTSTTAGGALPRRGGTLRASVIGSAADKLDAHALATEADNLYANALFDGLTQFDHQFRPQLALAEELTPAPDARSWTVRIRPDARFHDGRPVTADDVIFTIRRILDPRTGAAGALLLSSIDPSRLRKRDKHTLEIGLRQPDVSLDAAFAKYTGIVPVGYDPQRPVGSGPFKLRSFDPARRVVFDRFDDYYRPGLPYLDQLQFVVFTDQTALFNALQSGAVDAAGRLGASDVRLAEGNPRLRLVRARSGSTDLTVMRCDTGPFADVRVRQAMRLLADRQQLVDQVYGGYGRVGNDLPSPQDPAYASDIPQRELDVEQARSLLRAAGAEGLRVTYTAAPVDPFSVRQAEVVAEQAKAAGVEIRLDKRSDVGEYYAKLYGRTPLQLEGYFTNTLWFMGAGAMLPGAPFNTTHWSDERAARLFAEARGTLDESRRNELLGEFQRRFWDEGGWLVWGFIDSHEALSTRFAGLVPDVAGAGVNGGRYEQIGLAS
jgi:peptide/nickel transport system substrate-binding protein